MKINRQAVTPNITENGHNMDELGYCLPVEQQLIIDSVPVPLIYIHPQSEVLIATNKLFDNQFSPPPEVIGKPFDQLFIPHRGDIKNSSDKTHYSFQPDNDHKYIVKLSYLDSSPENSVCRIVAVTKVTESIPAGNHDPKDTSIYLEIPSQIGMALFDADFNIIDVNEIVMKYLGFQSKKKLFKQPLKNLFGQSKRFPLIFKKLKSDGRWKGQLIAIKQNGEIFEVLVEINKHHRSLTTPYAWSASFIDVTEQNKTQKEFLKTNSRLNNIVISAPNSILIADSKGNILFCNKKSEKLFGYTREELCGRRLECLIPKRFSEVFDKHLDEDFKNPENRSVGSGIELVGLKKDGTEFPVDITLSPFIENGEKRAVLIIHDTSSHKKIEKQLEQDKQYIQLLHKLSIIDNHTNSAEQILEKSIMECCQFLEWPVGHVYMKAKDDSGEYIPSGISYMADKVKYYAFNDITEQDRFVPALRMIEEVAATGKPKWLNNCQDDPEFIRRFKDIELGVWACIEIPVVMNKRVECVIELFSDQLLPDDSRLTDKLSMIGYQIGLVLERMQSKRALIKSQKKLKKIYDSTNDAILLTDGDFILDCNQKTLNFLNSEGINIDKLPINDLIMALNGSSDLTLNKVKKIIREATSNTLLNLEWIIETKNKKTIYTEIDLSPIVFENVNHLLIILRDVTARKKADKLIRKNVELFRQLFNNSPAGIVMMNSDWQVIEINRSFTEIFGYTLKEIKGKHLDDFFVPEDQKAVDRVYTSLTLNGNSFRVEAERFHKNGSVKHVVFGGGSVIIENELNAIFGVYVDITDRKWAEKEVIELNEDLEQKIDERTKQLQVAKKELEAFSYSVSHDLRAPLRSINGFSQALQENYEQRLDDTGKDYLERIIRATQKMSNLIDQLISLAKVSRATLKVKDVNLSAITENIMNQLKISDPERDVTVKIEQDIIDRADPALIEIVLQNLLENAWKYSSKEKNAIIEFGKTSSSGLKGYFVRDNGVGFDDRYEEKLFIAFQRLHSDNEFEGTGIGLATVKRIIEHHNGIVTAKSKVNEGTTFYFTLNP
jgi:PAS domain S-box-containing protein